MMWAIELYGPDTEKRKRMLATWQSNRKARQRREAMVPLSIELREDGGFELREDGGLELRG